MSFINMSPVIQDKILKYLEYFKNLEDIKNKYMWTFRLTFRIWDSSEIKIISKNLASVGKYIKEHVKEFIRILSYIIYYSVNDLFSINKNKNLLKLSKMFTEDEANEIYRHCTNNNLRCFVRGNRLRTEEYINLITEALSNFSDAGIMKLFDCHKNHAEERGDPNLYITKCKYDSIIII